MKVLVAGSRNWRNTHLIARELRALPDNSIIVHGGCGLERIDGHRRSAVAGADLIAGEIAVTLGFTVRVYPADWDKGKGAGPLRNAAMLAAEHKPDSPIELGLVFAYDLVSSRGSADMLRRLEAACITCRVVDRLVAQPGA